jgi:hypothetical protein
MKVAKEKVISTLAAHPKMPVAVKPALQETFAHPQRATRAARRLTT